MVMLCVSDYISNDKFFPIQQKLIIFNFIYALT